MQAREFLQQIIEGYLNYRVNQTDLHGKIRKKLGGQAGAKQKSRGPWPTQPQPLLRIATGLETPSLLVK